MTWGLMSGCTPTRADEKKDIFICLLSTLLFCLVGWIEFVELVGWGMCIAWWGVGWKIGYDMPLFFIGVMTGSKGHSIISTERMKHRKGMMKVREGEGE